MSLTVRISIREDNDPRYMNLDSSTLGRVNAYVRAEMSDANIHQWYALFERILALAGFDEAVIIDGACCSAFNETRPPHLVKETISRNGLLDLLPVSHQPSLSNRL